MHIDPGILEINVLGGGKKVKITIIFYILFYLLSFVCKYLIPKMC